MDHAPKICQDQRAPGELELEFLTAGQAAEQLLINTQLANCY